MNAKPIAKSLHTLTVLQQVAGYLTIAKALSLPDAMTQAAEILNLSGRDDPYCLIEKALRLMAKESGN